MSFPAEYPYTTENGLIWLVPKADYDRDVAELLERLKERNSTNLELMKRNAMLEVQVRKLQRGEAV